MRGASLHGFSGCFFPLDLALNASMLLALSGWSAAKIFGGDLGIA